MSDTHFVRPPTDFEATWWNRTTERFSREMGEALVDCIGGLSPDFVIHCGDFVGVDSEENFEYGLSFMERLGCPWYGVPGNHDTWTGAARNGFREVFGTGPGTWSYAREMGGLRFFFLDVVHWMDDRGVVSPVLDGEKYETGKIAGMGPTERDVAWLEDELGRTNLPSVLVTHAPIHFRPAYPVKTLPRGKPAESPRTPPRGFISGFLEEHEGRGRLLGLTLNDPGVRVCFAGHWHLNDAVERDGVFYVMTGALREFPYEVRSVEFDGGRMRVETHGLDVPRLREYSYVKEWGNDWIRGCEEAREFEIGM